MGTHIMTLNKLYCFRTNLASGPTDRNTAIALGYQPGRCTSNSEADSPFIAFLIHRHTCADGPGSASRVLSP